MTDGFFLRFLEFDKIKCKKHHLIGNHELYNFNRD